MSLELLVRVVAMVSIVLAAAWATTAVMRRSSAASRHAVWTAALVVALVLPVAALFGLAWELPVLNPSTGALPMEAPRAEITSTPSGDGRGAAGDVPTVTNAARDVAAEPTLGSAALVETTGARVASTEEAPAAVSPALVLALLWAAGVAVWMGRLAAGLARSWWVATQAERVTDPAWAASLADAATRLGLRSPVTLRFSEEATMPAVHGIWKATLLLPAGAAAWTRKRRRVVLLHELAHVVRGDVGVQVLARVVSALHWFNPLAHLAAGRLRLEQERACDDIVLTCGQTGPEYADHLVEIARDFRPSLSGGWASAGMARPSQLESRLRAILDPGVSRRGLSAVSRALLVASVMTVALPLGTLRVTASAEPQQEARSGEPAPTAREIYVQNTDGTGQRRLTPRRVGPAPQPVTDEVALVAAVPASAPAQVAPAPTPAPVVAPSPSVEASTTAVVDAVRARVAAAQVAAAQSQADQTQRRAVAALATAVNDEDETVRMHAVQALAGLGGEEAVDALTRALKDSSPDVRATAAQALGAVAHGAAGAQQREEAAARERQARERELAFALERRDIEARLTQAQERLQSTQATSASVESLRRELDQSMRQRQEIESRLREMERALAEARRQLEQERQR